MYGGLYDWITPTNNDELLILSAYECSFPGYILFPLSLSSLQPFSLPLSIQFLSLSLLGV